MSFDIARTPTLEAVATQDEQLLAHDLQKRLEQSILAAEAQDDVVKAVEEQRTAEDKLTKLRKAERSLTQFAKASREQALAAAQTALDGVIESAMFNEKPDLKKVTGLLAMENQNQFTVRAIERLVEHQIPLAKIASLREESHALMTRARAAERIAQERAERILGQVRDAVTEEMVLPIDLSKGVSGALLAHAAGLKRMAIQISANADEMEKSYCERRKQ
jgi:hypothetical protein